MRKDVSLLEIIDLVEQTLNEAKEYDLEIEVIASTIKMIKENPEMDISVALQNALTDWDI